MLPITTGRVRSGKLEVETPSLPDGAIEVVVVLADRDHSSPMRVATGRVTTGSLEIELSEVEVGGPQMLTWTEVARTAFAQLDRPARITRVPEWLMWAIVRLTRLFSRHQSELIAFFTTMATRDVVAPSTGVCTLAEHYRQLGAAR